MENREFVKVTKIEKNTTFFMPLVMMVIDYLAVVSAEELALVVRELVPWKTGGMHISWLNFWVTVPVIFILFMQVEKLYKRRAQFWQIIPKILHGCNYAILAVIVLMYVAKISATTSRVFVVLLWLFAFILLTIFRYVSSKFLENIGFLQLPVLLVGSGQKATAVAKGILNDAGMGYKIIGIVAEEKPESDVLKKFPFLGYLDNIDHVIKETEVKNVMFAIEGLPKGKFKTLVYHVQKLVKTVNIVPDFMGFPMSELEIEPLFTEKLVLLKTKNNLARPLNLVIKTVFDYVLTFFGTIAISPILLLIAFWIYKEDPGPIIFKHMRVGKDGKLFPCYKFRSMVTNSQEVLEHLLATNPEAKAEWEANFKLKNDPRVTKIGAFMRRTSIDELPQIFNVLKGEMSLVGPRPIIQKELDVYYKGYEDDYFGVKPGITGMWQVSGRSDTNYDERVELDRWYTANWSVWLDVMILYKTIAVVLLRKGAY
ncbi:MAG: undecaprenyl-phosphate galactose phosphotransferase WbaP [Phascolarctobacterium sp.]|nr:undecaprenyl-phosphate galactose phosphotransferase WbaP [Phascolarctobacterium sp.]